jgi:hypothetical protein
MLPESDQGHCSFKVDPQSIATTRDIAFHPASYINCIAMSSSPLQTYFAELLQERKATEVVVVEDNYSPTRITKHQFPVISRYEHKEQNKQPQRRQSPERKFRFAKTPDYFEKSGDNRLARRACLLYTQDDVIPIIKEKSITAKTA